MLDRICATDAHGQQDTGEGGYFASLGPARHLRLTTFKRDGIPVSASVHGVADGDRAYFRARDRSGTVIRLRHADAVQVTPCGALGFTYGPPLHAIARPLSGEEASLAAAYLHRRSPVRRRLLGRLFRRQTRQTRYYELLAADAPAGPDRLPEGPSASLITRVRTRQGFVPADAATPTSLATVCTPSTMSRLPDCTQITTVSMSLPS